MTERIPHIEFLDGIQKGTRIPLKKKRVIIGRGTGSNAVDIKINDPKSSTEHAVIFRNEKGYFISDTGSSNGTFVNGNEIDSWHLIGGDEIRIGSTRMLFLLPNTKEDFHPLSQTAEPLSELRDIGHLIAEEIGPSDSSETSILELSDIKLPPNVLGKPRTANIPSASTHDDIFSIEEENPLLDENDDEALDDVDEDGGESEDGEVFEPPVQLPPLQSAPKQPLAQEPPSRSRRTPTPMPRSTKERESGTTYGFLEVAHGKDQGKTFAINRRYCVLGRGSVDIRVRDLDVSRSHASISVKEDVDGIRLILKDLDSSNGTYINGERISLAEIKDGDLVQIGLTIMTLTLPKRP